MERTTITLHVGYGTFKPVRVDDVEAHVVDSEPYDISGPAAAAINRALDEGRRVIAVGTTTTRAIEHAAACGAGRVTAGRAVADLFIYPGVGFRVINGLLTNFHLPKSSLLMLVAAFGGRARVLEGTEKRWCSATGSTAMGMRCWSCEGAIDHRPSPIAHRSAIISQRRRQERDQNLVMPDK